MSQLVNEEITANIEDLYKQGYSFLVMTPHGKNGMVHIEVTYRALSIAVFTCNRRGEVVCKLSTGRNGKKWATIRNILS